MGKEKMTIEDTIKAKLKSSNNALRIGMAEFMGTFFLCLIGNAAVHESVLTGGSAFQVCFAFGMAVTFGVYISAGVSGGHINPAVTVAMASLGRLGDGIGQNAGMACVYILSQILGAFVSSIFVWIAYAPAEAYLIEKHNMSAIGMAGLYATWPTGEFDVSQGTLFYDQALGTFILVMVIFAVTDDKNTSPGNAAPILIGLAACVVGLSYGVNGGGGINPARDLGPRLFGLMMFGSEAFAGQHMFFWIPLVAPLVGGIVAAWTYLLTISAHHPDTSAQETDDFETDYKPVQTQDGCWSRGKY